MAKSKQPVREIPAPPEHLRGLRILADLAGGLASLADTGALQQAVLDHALKMFRCSSGAVCVWDGDMSRVQSRVEVGKAKGLRPEHLLETESVREVVVANRRPLVMADPGRAVGPVLRDWRGMAVIPIVGTDAFLGVLIVGDLAEGDAFTDSDTALMAALGNVVAVAFETLLVHAEFRDEMVRRMTEAMAELSRAVAELQRLKTFNEDLFESVPVGIIVFDWELRVTFRNSAANRLWPDDRSILTAARRTDLAQQDPDWEVGLRDVINMQRPWLAAEINLERSGQEPLRLNLVCSPLLSGQRNVVGGVLVVEDVTQRARMEKRLATSERLAGIGRLAAMVAHEINNPLDGILRLVNLARRVSAEPSGRPDPARPARGRQAADRSATAEQVEKYLAEAHKGLMRMATIVRDLLEFSRSATGTAEPMAIREILAESTRALAPAAEMAGVTIAIDCDDGVPLLKSGTLYQVILNLLKNAVEATPQGGLVTASARCEGDALVVEVADTGPGIPPEMLVRLFEPFYTLKATGKGTGLGLVISRDLIEKQGGTLVAANRPEGGAVFTVRLPLAPGVCGGS